MINSSADIEVAGRATDGQEGLRMAVRLHPDIITMDIQMPRMDGLEATRKIMALVPTPILVISGSAYANDTRSAFNAIEAGALTVIEKPRGLGVQDYEGVREDLLSTIRTMAGVKVIGRMNRMKKDGVGPMTAMLLDYFTKPVRVVAIGASTGGPPVLMKLFSSLPKDFSIPIVVVQHILPPFVEGMVEWLNSRSALPISIAAEYTKILPGHIYMSPGDYHLTLTNGGFIHLDNSEPVHGQRPSATTLFDSVARIFGGSSIGIILTGMGEDGVEGLASMSKAGAHIIAQNAATSVVFGMPGAAVKRNIVDEVLPPEEITSRLVKIHQHILTMGR